ncbi:MAG: leucine-rich repeat protein [Clostridiales bacterium]|nr:leucine-rich repeat protein [Clostridiales bacterium]
MKRKISKTLSIFFAVALILCAAPLSLFAELKLPALGLPEWCEEKILSLTSLVSNSSVTSLAASENVLQFIDNKVYKCDQSASGTVVIPSTLNGNPVIGIWSGAFEDCAGITGITIPNSVKSIGDGAFYGCSGLKSITIPSSVTSVGGSSFGWGEMFGNCTSLTNLTVEGDTKFSVDTFQGCDALTSLTIGSEVTDATNILKALYHGNISVDITSIQVDPDSAFYSSEGSVLFSKDKSTLVSYPIALAAQSYVVPDSVSIIHDGAFENCQNLTDITLSDSVTTIGCDAFRNCRSLSSIVIPAGVTSVDGYAFSDCTSLSRVTIESAISSISKYMFCDCSALTSISIPKSVTQIGDDAFAGCTSLTSVTIPESVIQIDERAFAECTSLTSVTIPKTMKVIADDAFEESPAVTIRCYEDSVAHRYALKYLIDYELISAFSDDYKLINESPSPNSSSGLWVALIAVLGIAVVLVVAVVALKRKSRIKISV